MDKLKPILQVLVKYQFWFISGVILVLPVGGWLSATSQLDKEFDERKTAIKGKIDQVQNVVNTANHPNKHSEDGMDAYISQLKREVYEAWLYQYQRQDEILDWPKELGADFIQRVEKLQPIEEKLPYPTPIQDELHATYRERYRDYIKKELPKLAEMIGAVWRASPQGAMGSGSEMSGMPGMAGFGSGYQLDNGGSMSMGVAGPGMPIPGTAIVPTKEVVLWSPQDQAGLQHRRFDWSTYPDKVPKTLDLLYAQEDLWVLRALMQIVARTNRDATGRYNAIVKEIRYINLGRTVGRKAGLVMRVRAGGLPGMAAGEYMGEEGSAGMGYYDGDAGSSSAGEMGSEGYYDSGEGSAGMESGSMMPGGEPGSETMPGMSEGMAGMPVSRDPAAYRYVDTNYQPITAERLRQAVSPDNRNPDDAFLVVAKRIPIRLGLVMDHRKLPRFVTECGNASLMVEVRQVRLNRQGAAAGGMGSMGGMDSMGGMESTGGMPGFGGSGSETYDDSGNDGSAGMPGFGGFGGMGSGYYDGGSSESEGGSGYESGYATGGASGDKDKSPYDLPVEIYGMVYIYNPVAMDKLGIENKEADTSPVEANPAIPGAATGGVVPAASEGP